MIMNEVWKYHRDAIALLMHSEWVRKLTNGLWNSLNLSKPPLMIRFNSRRVR